MFTYCPNCYSIYEVSSELIDQAAGQTRCSACQQVFRAIDYLFDDLEATRNVINEQRTGNVDVDVDVDVDADGEGDGKDKDADSGGWQVTTESYHPGEPLPGGWQARALSLHDIGRGVAVGFLTLLLSVQWVYFNRDMLAAKSAWRPAIERFCEVLVCDLSLRVDRSQLQIIERDVREHPSVADALLINVAFENRANFIQKYPVFEVSFTDTLGDAIAMRRFSPADYLASDVDVPAGIPAHAPVQVVLEVIDPGERAVSFEFAFL